MVLWFTISGMPCNCHRDSLCALNSLYRITVKIIIANKYLKLLFATVIKTVDSHV